MSSNEKSRKQNLWNNKIYIFVECGRSIFWPTNDSEIHAFWHKISQLYLSLYDKDMLCEPGSQNMSLQMII